MPEPKFLISIDPKQVEHPVSETLFGLFIEDINYTCDGGLNANMIVNNSFDALYFGKQGKGIWASLFNIGGPVGIKPDRLQNWKVTGGKLESLHDGYIFANSWYARVYADGFCRLENLGFNGFRENIKACAVSIYADKTYAFSCYLRNRDFTGTVSIVVEDVDGNPLTEQKACKLSQEWTQIKLNISGHKTDYGKLALIFDGNGAVDIDFVSLMDSDVWGTDDPKWSQGKLRRDMVEILRDLKPTFLRFPGGSLVEGVEVGQEYRWKDSIGPVERRVNNVNFWATYMPTGEYSQSFQVGFYEYFLLCEDLKMQPVPVVWAGISLTQGKRGRIPMNTPEFQELVIQNALDLVEYANGDSKTSQWAKIRADAGRPEPFNMKFLGIGNENPGDDYLKRFQIIEAAIKDKYPDMICIMSSGLLPAGKAVDRAWQLARTKYPDCYVDEHFYGKPDKVIKRQNRYDNYPRDTAKVFLGEYAGASSLFTKEQEVNNYHSALGEAVFLTGLERNSDVVVMTCYAPLFSFVSGKQWKQNLINFNPAHVLRTTNYYVQQMFGTSVGDRVVKIAGELPAGIFASATAAAEMLIIKLVNVNPSPLAVELVLSGIANGKAELVFLQSDDLTAFNTLEFKGDPVYRIVPITQESAVIDGKLNMTLANYSIYVITLPRC